MKKILVMNGPNLNLTGIRNKNVYGAETLEDINRELAAYGEGKGVQVDFYQSNHEGALIDKIHASRTDYDGVVLNAGAYTHYSYAIRDAIEAVQDFRRISVLTPVCVKQICGFGKDSYKMGIDLLLEIL